MESCEKAHRPDLPTPKPSADLPAGAWKILVRDMWPCGFKIPLRYDQRHVLTRRRFLQQSQLGIGAIALSSLLARNGVAAPVGRSSPDPAFAGVINPLASRQPHFPAKAKQVIYLHMTGSPPNLD